MTERRSPLDENTSVSASRNASNAAAPAASAPRASANRADARARSTPRTRWALFASSPSSSFVASRKVRTADSSAGFGRAKCARAAAAAIARDSAGETIVRLDAVSIASFPAVFARSASSSSAHSAASRNAAVLSRRDGVGSGHVAAAVNRAAASAHRPRRRSVLANRAFHSARRSRVTCFSSSGRFRSFAIASAATEKSSTASAASSAPRHAAGWSSRTPAATRYDANADSASPHAKAALPSKTHAS